MLPILLVLLLVIILGGFGFAFNVLWWIAGVVLVIWLLGFLFRTAEGARPPPVVSLVSCGPDVAHGSGKLVRDVRAGPPTA